MRPRRILPPIDVLPLQLFGEVVIVRACQTAPLLLLALLVSLVISSVSAGSAPPAAVPLRIDNGVVPQASKGFLSDPRIFSPEFYRKFYPQLQLANDAAATREWTSRSAKACRRGSFFFSARDYVGRYRDLAKYDCVAAAEHFVTAGFNEGRIGAADSYWVVFDFNYYVDAVNNSDLNKAYATHVWDQVDLQVHWLQHGIGEQRRASPFFSVGEYQARYPDAPRDPARAISQYVATGQASGRLGRAAWAEPAAWSALVQGAAPPVVSATPDDVARSFTSVRGAPLKVVVKSPAWYRASLTPPWRSLIRRKSARCRRRPPPTT